MAKMLRISDDLSLPLDAATRRIAILGMSGSGKSNVGVALAEAMTDAGIPWFVIDPKGDWWGVRSSKDGKGPGLSIPIFGGLHGDIPLDPKAGVYIANLIVNERLTCVLDVSEFDNRQDIWRFIADFGETVLRKNMQALHGFFEECDEYIPQNAKEGGNLSRCLGVMQRYVKRGRFRALGCTQISQRSAAVNKDALYQAEVMIAMRVTGKGDRKAIAGWVEHHGAADEIEASLPTLADGEGWVTSPAWLRETKRVKFLRRRTFDSGATPVTAKGGKARAATLADVDLSAIEKQMVETIERAKAEDPTALRGELALKSKRVAELERELQRAKDAPPTGKTKTVEKPVIAEPVIKRIETLVAKLGPLGDALKDCAATVRQAGVDALLAQQKAAGAAVARSVPAATSAPRSPSPPRSAPARGPAPRREAGGDGALTGGELAVMKAVAMYPDGIEPEGLSVLTGYTRSSRNTFLQRLGARGFIERRGSTIRPTDAGIEGLGSEFEPLPTGEELREWWLGRLGEGGERRTLEVLIAEHPAEVPRDQLQESTGYTRSSSNTFVQRLGAKQLVMTSRDGVRASDNLFG